MTTPHSLLVYLLICCRYLFFLLRVALGVQPVYVSFSPSRSPGLPRTDMNGRCRFLGIPRYSPPFPFCTVLLFVTLILVSTGSAGIIQTIQRFSHGALVAGVLGIVATVGWAVQGLGNAFYYRQVTPPQSCHDTAIHSETDLGTSQLCWSHNGKGKLGCNL